MRTISRTRNDLSDLLGIEGIVALDAFESKALANNPLGDRSDRPLGVYTPPGYDPEGSRRYPVLYLLHGYTGDLAGVVGTRLWEKNVVQRLDRLIAGKKMSPAIMVIVDGVTRLGGSQYVNSIHNGDYASYVVHETLAHVDRNYRTIPRAEGRGVLGKSTGGFGSLYLTMNYPGHFGAFASHSGDSYFRMCQVKSLITCGRVLERYPNFEAFVQAFEAKEKPKFEEVSTMEMLGYAAAYSPTAAKAFAFDLPIDVKTGAFRDDVWARWLAFDPTEQIPHKRTELAALRLRYIDCGRRDEYGLDIGARVMAQQIRDLGLDVRHEEFDDDHMRIGYRYDVSLPALAEVLDRE
ncbi:MAG TPA: alpha/beta hydrolase-fold protein [Candidatus Baltobacteraceae bacterium]|jgi:enterochelin esterase family protein